MIKNKRRNKYFLRADLTIVVCIVLIATSFSSSITSQAHNYDERNAGNHIVLTYSFEEPTIHTTMIGDEIYHQVMMKDTPNIEHPGEPNLPVYGAKILLPQGTKPGEIEVVAEGKVLLGESINVVPGSEPVPLSMIESHVLPNLPPDYLLTQNPSTEPNPNEAIYASTDEYPRTMFTSCGVQCFRGFDILILDIYPVHYIPASGTIYYYSSLTVNIEVAKDETSISPLFRDKGTDRQELMTKVDNPDIALTYSKGNVKSTSSEDYDLLILTTDELRDGFEPLKDVHDSDGVSTTIKTLTDIGGNPEEITPEDVRDFIRDEYTNSNISYVLIGGDNDVIPARNLYFGFYKGEDYHGPSDLYYSCLDGPFNFDGDDKWGEYGDGENGGEVDLYAEVYVGRACVGSIAEVNHFVNKTIAYLSTDPDDPYLDKVLLSGEYLWGPPEYSEITFGGDYMDELINGSSANGYTTVGIPSDLYNIETLYDRDWPGFDLDDPWNTGWPKSEIVERINNSVHIINHLGHASSGYVMKMWNVDVSYLLTNDQYCFMYSQGCYAGDFDEDDCVAEYLTVKTEHGAFAVIMNARSGWGTVGSTDGPSQHFDREFWDAVFSEGYTTIGAANQDSKEDNVWRINESRMRWCCYELNLFGDPTLDFFGQIGNEPPEQPEIPSGTEVCRPSVDYLFSTNTSDPEDDDVCYLWDWDDGTTSDWLGPYPSGEICSISHNWTDIDMYNVRVRARDSWYQVSEWSDPLPVNVNIETIYVDDDAYPSWYDATHVRTIQEGVNNITYAGDIVYVYNGTYIENILVDETLCLIGENKNTTIIDGGGSGDVVCITADDVLLHTFTLQNGDQGILVSEGCDFTEITDTIIMNNDVGIHLENSSNATIYENNIVENAQYGVYISIGGRSSDNNDVYHNNFIDNTQHAYDQGANRWDDGYPSGGNYWGEDYAGVDNNYGPNQDIPGSDGIGDTPYIIDENSNVDHYPLMNPWNGTSPVPPVDTVYVDDDFNASTPGWEYTHFDNIQDGIDIIEKGGTVHVFAGMYNGQVDINKTIDVVGQDKNSTVIMSNGSTIVMYVSADWVNISGFTIRDGGYGIMIISDHNTVSDTHVTNNSFGIYIISSYNHIYGNIVTNITGERGGGIFIYEDASCNLIADNKVLNDFENPSWVGIWVVFSFQTFQSPVNNTIISNTVSYNNTFAVALIGSPDNTVAQNNISNNLGFGVFLQSYDVFLSEDNTICDNTIVDNGYNGVYFMDSSVHNMISDNIITNNNLSAIYIEQESVGNTFINNSIEVSGSGPYWPRYGFYFENANALNSNIDVSNTINGIHGVLDLSNVEDPTIIEGLDMEYPEMTNATNYGLINLYKCSNVTIRECHLANHTSYGMYLHHSSNNILSDSTINNNNQGIYLQSSCENNHLYHNNIIDNTQNAYGEGDNIWDEGYPFGGNYWSDYQGGDEYNGPGQNISGYDGIGDTPYTINGDNNQDRYPFIEPEGWLLNYPPYTPRHPSPENHAIDVNRNTNLSWIGGDPDPEDIVTYDVYLGTTYPLLKMISNQSETTFEPGTMDVHTKYYWQVVAWDDNASTPCSTGPIWEFTTEDDVLPEWQNQGQSKEHVHRGGSVTLYAQGKDNISIDRAYLSTNETGEWADFSGGEWWNVNWNYCKQIQIDHTKVAADLTNFPILISLVSSDFTAHAQPDGDDFVFVASDNKTVYGHEIEYYNNETGELVAWVNIPFLSSTEDTILYLYYGNPDCGNQENSEGVWDENFLMVHHMTGANYDELDDSTANHWDVTSQSGDPMFNINGKVGKCVDLDGNNDYFKTGNFRLATDTSYTASAWLYADGGTGSIRNAFEGDSDFAVSLLVWSDSRFKNYCHNSGGTASCYSTTVVDEGNPEWFYVTTRADADANILDIFVNGIGEDSDIISGTINEEPQGLNIGCAKDQSKEFNGLIDELRVSNVTRSDDWISTEYNMMTSPEMFITVGNEKKLSKAYGSPMDLSYAGDQWVWSNFTWQNASIPEGTTVGWKIHYVDKSWNEIATDIMSFHIDPYYIDSDQSYLTLTGGTGMHTALQSQYAEWYPFTVTVIDTGGQPLDGILASVFDFTAYLGDNTISHCDLNSNMEWDPIDAKTDVNGEIRFRVKCLTSVTRNSYDPTPDGGYIDIKATIDGVELSDTDSIPVNTCDINCDGWVSLVDFARFAVDFGLNRQRSDYDFDLKVDMDDFSDFAVEFGSRQICP